MSHEASNWARQCGKSGVLKPGEILVLMLMADHADERWSCFPSQETLALDSNQSLRTVSSQVKRLRELELISVESEYGVGRGRIGVRYHLHEEAAEALMLLEPYASQRAAREAEKDARRDKRSARSRESTRHANGARKSWTPRNTRHADPAPESSTPEDERHAESARESLKGENMRDADLAPESVIPGMVRDADSAGESLTRNLAHDSHANPGGVPLRERARINHQINHHHPAGAKSGAGVDDDDDDLPVHRSVRLDQLFELVPALTGTVTMHELPVLVDVVLDRATGAIARPTAYVARALDWDLDGVLEAAARRWPVPAPVVPASGATQPVPVPGSGALRAGREPVPCTNADHDGITNPKDCHHCRLEPRVIPSVSTERDLSPAEVEALPARLRERLGVG